MNKVICDVCGTTYPETASQCPICGCAKPEDVQVVSADAPGVEGSAAGTYTYVKGGRFSKSNVRKRAKTTAPRRSQGKNTPAPVKQRANSNTGLIAVAVLLVLAIIAMLFYIYFAYFAPQKPDIDNPNSNISTTTAAAASTDEPMQTQAATTTAPQQIKCTELKLSEGQIQLDAVGNAWLINVTPVPSDTTDSVTYSTSDPNVATVTSEGCITAVGPGTTVITVTCGDITQTCNVTCNIETEPTTAPTTAPTTQPAADEIKLNRKDITFTTVGEAWTLYRGNISLTEITWSSDDDTIATFAKGVVTAVGNGTTEVHAEYNGKKVSCIIRCNIPTETVPGETQPDTTEPTTEPTSGGNGTATATISHTDVSISVGETFRLRLKGSDGNYVDVTWAASKDGVCTINGNSITGVAIGKATVSCTYEGKTYSCIVRVK